MNRVARSALLAIAIGAISLATSCVSYRASLNPSAELPKDRGCLYGRFSFGDKSGSQFRLALVVTEQATKKKHRIRFRTDSGLAVIDVPPGEYAITHFTLAAWGAIPGEWKDIPFSPSGFSTPFRVEPDHIYYLGDYVGSTHMWPGVGTVIHSAEINSCKDDYEATTAEVRRRYPHLSNMQATSTKK